MKKTKVDSNAPSRSRSESVLIEIMSGDPVRIALSVVLGFVIGAIFMAGFNEDVVAAWSNFSADPSLAFSSIWWTIQDGYGALFQASVVNLSADNFVDAIRPITETLRFAAPLIMAGLGVALTFRVGLFNIGATGQIMMGLAGATFVSTKIQLPIVIHMLAAVIAAVIAAALWGAIVGFLKARTGAHEVIVTIMLNYVAANFILWLLNTKWRRNSEV